MSEAATEDVQTTDQAFDNPADEIANLLLGDEDTTESDEAKEEETPAEASTEDEEVVDESEEESESEEEIAEESDDEDQTWGKALGVPEDSIAFDTEGNITGVNVKVNGKMDTVAMADLIKDYQGGKSFTEKSQSLATERKAFDDAKKVVEQEYSSKLENVETITNYLSNKLVSEFEGINWDQLRVENPAEYAAARQDYSARAQELKQAQEAVGQEKAQATEKQTQESNATRAKRMEEQFNIMITNNPDWADKETRSAAMTGLQDFAINQYGFVANDFNSVEDARLLELLKDAKAYREGVKIATTKRKKAVPKFQKSKGLKAKKVSKLDKLTKAARTAKGHTQRDLQAEAVAQLLTGG